MPTDNFRIYVASLADYNNGTLYGEWLDLEDYSDVEDLQEAVNAMLIKSPFCNSEFAKKHGLTAEKYVIHDYEGFPSGSISEYKTLSDVWKLWEEFEQAKKDDNVEAFTTYKKYFDGDYSDFEDSYRGHYQNEEAFAEELLDGHGNTDTIPEHLRCYFDYEAYARALFSSGFTMIDGFVFWNW